MGESGLTKSFYFFFDCFEGRGGYGLSPRQNIIVLFLLISFSFDADKCAFVIVNINLDCN